MKSVLNCEIVHINNLHYMYDVKYHFRILLHMFQKKYTFSTMLICIAVFEHFNFFELTN